MQVFIALLWVFLVLVALILPVLMLIWLWGRIRLVLNQLGNTADQLGYTARKSKDDYRLKFRLRKSGLWATSKDLEAAEAQRNLIRQRRYLAKNRRLEVAKARWQKLGLV